MKPSSPVKDNHEDLARPFPPRVKSSGSDHWFWFVHNAKNLKQLDELIFQSPHLAADLQKTASFRDRLGPESLLFRSGGEWRNVLLQPATERGANHNVPNPERWV
jgi:hypothetical protein